MSIRIPMSACVVALVMATPTLATDPAQPIEATSTEPDNAAAMTDALAIVELSGTGQVMTQMLETLGPVMAQALIGRLGSNAETAPILTFLDEKYAGGSKAFSSEFVKRFKAKFVKRQPELQRLAAREYVARLSPADLAELHQMMATPAYQNLVKANPDMQLAMSSHGEKLGSEIAEQVMRSMLSETLGKLEPVKSQ